MRHAQAAFEFNETGVPRSSFYDSPFGRMFSKVEPWEPEQENHADVRAAFVDFANNNMVDDGAPDGDNPEVPAGYTYFGQFVDHDITFDPTTSLMRHNDPNKHRNFRTPRLDLDSVYAGGPDATPFLYQDPGADDGRYGFFLIGSGQSGVELDLPRNQAGTALIGDPRNDENIIVSQIHLGLLLFHNKVLREIVGDDTTRATGAQFRQAQRIVRWTYQYIVWRDFVKRIVSGTVFDATITEFDLGKLKARRLYYKWRNDPYIPVEFSVAAYRIGHAMVRNDYQVNNGSALGFGVTRPIFSNDGSADLRGGKALPVGHAVQWDWFLDINSGGPFPQLARKFNPLLSSGVQSIPTPEGPTPLAVLNLLRSWRMELPSGTDVARYMGIPPRAVSGIDDVLWVYILAEAAEDSQMGGKGLELGSLGSRIVAEVFAGLLLGDPSSFASLSPEWTPDTEPVLANILSAKLRDDWEFADLIRATGLPIDNADSAALETEIDLRGAPTPSP